MKRDIEILAPVGNRDMLNAAIAAGTGAVYLASKDFGARAYADNFTNDELKEIIDFCHWNSVKVYITLNTMIKESEIKNCIRQAEMIIKMGCDAIIIQDIGLINIIHKMYPTFPLHGSTQMSVTSLEGALALKELGLARIVAGRECSIDEIERMVKHSGLEVEVFVHGSLCVSVSGQCYLSSFAGGRSGNRGRCAQPCRKKYDLLSGNRTVIRRNTLLSPRDLCTIDEVEKLYEIGVSSIKIEGRMKKPEYVYAAVSAYKEKIFGENIDKADIDINFAEKSDVDVTMAEKSNVLRDNLKNNMMLMTNRPFTKGFLFKDFGKSYGFIEENSTGINVGKVKKDKNGMYFISIKNLKKGDIIKLKSTRHFFSLTITDEVKKNERYDLKEYTDLIVGETVYQIYTESVRSELKSKAYVKKRLIDINIELRVGINAKVTAVSDGVSVTVYGDEVSEASNRPVSYDSVEKSMLKLGNTLFEINELDIEMDDNIFIAISRLNALRRDAVQGLEDKIVQNLAPIYEKVDCESLDAINEAALKDADTGNNEILMNDKTCVNGEVKKIENKSKTCISIDTYRCYNDFKDVTSKVSRIYVHEISQIREFKENGLGFFKNVNKQDVVLQNNIEVYFVIPRLMEEKEASKLKHELLNVIEYFDGFSVATSNELGFCMDFGKPVVAEYTWNLANASSFDWASNKFEKFMPSVELTYKELNKIKIDVNSMEIPVYGKIQGMLLKYCPASVIKGCKDNSGCKTCNFSKKLYLKDSFGKREILRRGHYSELYVPETLDLRDKNGEILNMDPGAIRIYDRGEKEIFKVIEDWENSIFNCTDDRSDGETDSRYDKKNVVFSHTVNRNDKNNKTLEKHFLGHFDSAIE